jgi:4-amino-4-deoxy-L-arabinose transferase-like glycosyltransferase
LEWSAFAVVLLAAAFLRLWRIDQNGTGNAYYAAAVRSMSMNWHNFFFVSFDPAGFVTVDKPPVSLWIQTAFAKLLGYRGFTLILPQVLEGLGALLVVWHLVRRRFGSWAAWVSALALAVSPVSVAVDRYNNTDACLVLVLVLAAWALIRALETGNRMLLYLALLLVGVGFNTKMMAAFVVLPAFYLTYLVSAPLHWFKRLWTLFIGTIILLVVALSWPLAVDLTPPEQRPFVGSTQDNSMISLSLGWNGFQRLLARGRRGFPQRPGFPNNPAANPTPRAQAAPAQEAVSSSSPSPMAGPASTAAGPATQGPGRRGGFMGNGTPGLFRLADKNMAGQMAWFLPLALLGFWSAARRVPWTWPLSPAHRPLVLWLAWFLIYAAVFSFMRGAMHPYYLVLMVPAVAALTGIGLRALWLDFEEGKRLYFPLGLLLTAAWQSYIVFQYPDWRPLLMPILLLAVVLAIAGLFYLGPKIPKSPWLKALGVLGLCSLFLCPLFWALTPILGPGQSVEANPDLLGGTRAGMFRGFEQNLNNTKLLDFLRVHRQGEQYIVVAQNSQFVAPIIIQTGEPAVAIGGFMGGDPILTANQFAQMVQEGFFRYMLLPNPNPNPARPGNSNGRGPGGNAGGFGGFGFGRGGNQADIAKWVREHGKPVDPVLWRPALPPALTAPQTQAGGPGFPGGFGGRRGGIANLQLYDLRPGQAAKTDSKN